MTAPWSGAAEAEEDEELAEGVGSADAVASAVGAVLGLAEELGAVDTAVGVELGVVVCWRDRAVAAAHPRAGTITRMARKGHTFFHLDGLGRCMPTGISSPARSIHPWGTETHAFRLSEKREWGAGGARVMWRGLCGIRLVL